MTLTDELRTVPVGTLMTAHQLNQQVPITEPCQQLIHATRHVISQILHGHDPRLLVIIGPCSIHDTAAAVEYATRLKSLREKYQDRLEIVMRTYFEKPRTIVGWKGLINDPHLDGSHDINHGLVVARQLLSDINALGVPTATEFLDMVTGQYIADLISWGAIGARTTESQIHREMASALSCPVGFKNGTDGNCKIAMDAVRAAQVSHLFLSPDKQGQMSVYQTRGNPDGHVILRGGKEPNYQAKYVKACQEALAALSLSDRMVIDCSHGNCLKQHKRQLEVASDIAEQLSHPNHGIAGVMVESFLVEGRQDWQGNGNDRYGQSITDACLGWEDTEQLLATLAAVPSQA
ncbi:3-deoxy-7-phosphoheptulonate synthase [Rosenbergiella epipactidis]|uniref:3-deoxy-7-phosphoheptulonate synthase n=1 Tax=Rosenbergiella epipactidis TaxID=1544694 RepID=UPI00066475E9|nr:3-deoxy-7-phosphoheptulonate synthase [Rosenbergiella epipactidis]KMV73449.1 phospho-2-dehydro-3-deoxyheptonate aldolase [bacteria symbiont BFo2 of Frankliniella occidentalis]KYP91190.1 phospho-2-dehydro-3-deoxyheptonate aldolase [bacteria symbiont BFo2 of Frankliniella occidentalis]KYP94883.1 phospho-2-dehydro-3-deoxyheptonate aldolase [bacteria symbiont BFo2 of Frankliniella occidentalis]